MTIQERDKLFFDNRDIIFELSKQYNPNHYDIDEIIDAGITGLFNAIDALEADPQLMNKDFKSFSLFYIKSSINNYIQENT